MEPPPDKKTAQNDNARAWMHKSMAAGRGAWGGILRSRRHAPGTGRRPGDIVPVRNVVGSVRWTRGRARFRRFGIPDDG